MKRWSSTIVVLLFAVAVGDFAFRTWNFPLQPEYMTQAVVRPLSAAAAGGKHLYLRRSWHLTRTPEQAWIELLGHDQLELFVNGRRAGRTERSNRNQVVALVTDITPFLHEGKNSIAVHVSQTRLDRARQSQSTAGADSQTEASNRWMSRRIGGRPTYTTGAVTFGMRPNFRTSTGLLPKLATQWRGEGKSRFHHGPSRFRAIRFGFCPPRYKTALQSLRGNSSYRAGREKAGFACWRLDPTGCRSTVGL